MNASLHCLAFAGGGSRCWWQAGLVERLKREGWTLPPLLVGTSAGAGVAAALLNEGVETAIEACERLYARTEHMLDRTALTRLRLRFAHDWIYPAWVGAFVTEQSFSRMRAGSQRLQVAITRPARVLGLAGSVLAGTLAYLVDKKLAHSIHPRLPRWLGLRQEFVDINACADLAAAHLALRAAGAAPPFMPGVRLGGRWALDGGYTDNAPIPTQSAEEKQRTLVLLTRHYPGLPSRFAWRGRQYWQPSRPIPVSTFACTRGTPVRDAYALGWADAEAALRRG